MEFVSNLGKDTSTLAVQVKSGSEKIMYLFERSILITSH